MTLDTISPLFVIALPRSGSTLLQRVLATHPQIATAPETWSAIPLVYALRSENVGAEYNHETLVQAHLEMLGRLPGRERDYWRCAAIYLESLYRALANPKGSRYFLDKTPRYALIVHELKAIFPAGKFIVLWRNPLAALASRFHSYGNRWRVFNYSIDLYAGLENVLSFARKHVDSIYMLRYEDFVESPEKYLAAIGDYLGIDAAEFRVVDVNSVEVSSKIGDQTGRNRYSKISKDSLETWKVTLSSSLRRAFARSYLNYLGSDAIAFMGYDYNQLRTELDNLPVSFKGLISDVARASFGWCECRLSINLIRRRWKTSRGRHYPLL